MAEIDGFERSLAGAFLRLADDVPGSVDAAAVAHRVALEHPRGKVGVRWGPIATPRPAWVLLLLAGLLSALVGGTLLVGSQMQRRLPAVVPPVGQAYECPPGSTPDEPGPVDQARPSLAAMGIAFDRRAGRLVAVTGAGPGVETWTFDVCTNTWTQMHPNREPPGVGFGGLVYDVDSDVTILVSIAADPSIARVNVWAYDLQADAWTEKGEPPSFIDPVSLAYDPVSGLVVAAGVLIQDTLIWTYDVESDAWTPIQQANAGPSDGAVYVFGSVIAYDASVDRIVAYTKRYNGYGHEAETWLFDVRTGTWSRSNAQTPHVVQGLGLPDIEYDEAARRTVIMGTVAAAYDASADRWAMLDAGQSMVYDPVNERLVGRGPHYGMDDAAGVPVGRADVFAFDPGTGAWTVLLEPGEGQPANPPAPMPAPTPARTPAPSGGPVASCPRGSNPDEPGPVEQARPPTFEMSMAFDRAAGKIVALAADGTWTFDVCTNTWTPRRRPAPMPHFDLFRMLVYDAGARQTIYVAENGVWAYDLASDTWTRRGDAPEADVLQVRLAYDPVGGRVVALELGAPGPTWSGRMWSYDASADAWQPVAQDEQLSAETGRQILLAYDQSVGQLVGYSQDGEVRLFDLGTGTWSAPRAESPLFTYGTPMMNPFSFGGEIAYDEAARRTVLFSNGTAIAYDARSDRWETLCGGSIECAIPPECRTSPHMVYDPVNERLVVYGGVFCAGDYWYRVFEGYGAPDEVLAFDLRTREWTVLVERSSARPAP